MKKTQSSGMSLVEILISTTILAMVATTVFMSMIKTTRTWNTNAQEISANSKLQLGLTACSQDLIRAKYSSVVLAAGTTFDSIKFSGNIQYTKTGVLFDGGEYVDHSIRYIVKTESGKASLYRQLLNASGTVVKERNLVYGLATTLDSTKTGDEAWKQKPFALKIYTDATTGNNQIYIYIRLDPSLYTTKDSRVLSNRLELVTKVFIRG